MKYKTLEETSVAELFTWNSKVFKALISNVFYFDLVIYLLRVIKVMFLPFQFFNLASQLTPEQMRALQLELNGVNLTNLKRIEEILGDYGLKVETLSEKQIRGFAKFVKSF
jgi:hypothetical protein